MTELDSAIQGSTYVAVITFKDEAGDAMTPVSAEWSLYDEKGEIVNSKSQVPIVVASTVNIVLSGDDIPYDPATSRALVLSIAAVYDGDYGNNLPLNQEFLIPVEPIIGV